MTTDFQPPFSETETALMRRAIFLARRGEGLVEPNPMVGAVVADAAGKILGEGWHQRFGEAHAEVNALSAAGAAARGATLYVTLEPCCHHGKTPPCTEAILAAGISRVVVATADPFPAVGGGGLTALRQAGVQVDVGLLEAEAIELTAPFRTLIEKARPWVIAKWAMTRAGQMVLPDGVSGTGPAGSRGWISSAASRAIVHDLRRRVDAIVVGIETALADDPLLTARPPGPRRLLRVVLDRKARLPLGSRLVQTAGEQPLVVAVGPAAAATRVAALQQAGCDVWQSEQAESGPMLAAFCRELGRRQVTNLMVEGGGAVLQAFFQAGLVDEAWAFIAPQAVGSQSSRAGLLATLPGLRVVSIEQPGGDLFLRGRIESRVRT